MLFKQTVIVTIIATIFVSCNSPVQSENGKVKPISDVTFSYLQDNNAIFVSANVEKSFNGLKLLSVQLHWFGAYGFDLNSPDSVYLNDAGDFGDILKNNGVYSREISNNDLTNGLVYKDTGNVYLEIVSMYVDSSTQTVSDSFNLGNIKPKFAIIDTPDVWIVAPDTINKPNTPDTTINYTIRTKVIDANGMDDIKSVGFTWKSLSDGQILNDGEYDYLFDDGETELNGDSTSNDSIYSGRIAIDFYQDTGLVEWRFRVLDFDNDYSDTTHTVLIIK